MKLITFALSLLFTASFGSCFKDVEKTKPPSEKQEILLSGTIDLQSELRSQADPLAVIFVTARTSDGRIGAVKKLLPPFQYPVAFELTSQDLMIPGLELKGQILPSARLDVDANANPPQAGDILGYSNPQRVRIGESVKIVLQEVFK